MILHKKILSSISYNSKKNIEDYYLIYSLLKKVPAMGLLPSPIAESENKLKLLKRFEPSIDICLIYNANRTRTKGFKNSLITIKKLLTKT